MTAIPTGLDPHLAFVRDDVVPRTPQGCEECLRIRSPWVHLRLCLTCGHVGCCDSSPNRHAREACGPGRPSDRAVLRAGRGLALVLRRRGARVTPGADGVSTGASRSLLADVAGRARPPTCRGPSPGSRSRRSARWRRGGSGGPPHAARCSSPRGSRRAPSTSCSRAGSPSSRRSGRRTSGWSGCTGRGASSASSACSPGRPPSSPASSRDPGEVLAIPVDRLRDLVAEEPALGDLVLRAYLLRRCLALGEGVGFRIVGSRYSAAHAGGCASSPPATGSRTAGSTWRPTRRPRRCCASSGVAPEETPVVIWPGPGAAQPAQRRAGRGVRPARAVDTEARSATWWSSAPGPPGSRPPSTARPRAWTRSCSTRVATGGQAAPDVADRELPRLSGRDLRGRAGRARGDPGGEVRRADHRAGRGGRHWSGRDGNYVRAVRRRWRAATRRVIVATGARIRRLAGAADWSEFEGTCVYYAATPDRGPAVRRRPGGGRRRRQLRRPGRGLPRRPRRRGPHGGPGGRRSTRTCRATSPTGSAQDPRIEVLTCTPRSRELVRARRPARGGRRRGHDDRRAAAPAGARPVRLHRRGTRARSGCPTRSRSTRAATS